MHTAHRLHAAWPEADYIVVPDGGHSLFEPTIRSRLIEATENAKSI
jgi:proline iminopeptidase